LLLALLCVLALSGCAAPKATPAETIAQGREQCFANEKQITMALDLVNADSGIYPDVTDVVKKLGVKCPDGGTYSFDSATNVVSCSVHGHP
jgi:hypothetical protein